MGGSYKQFRLRGKLSHLEEGKLSHELLSRNNLLVSIANPDGCSLLSLKKLDWSVIIVK